MGVQLEKLLDLFSTIGKAVPRWTQGQGSNLSYKSGYDQKMYIKPSGYRLDQVTSLNDLVVLNLKTLNSSLDSIIDETPSKEIDLKYSQVINESKISVESSLRPSMETGFHNVLQGSYVMHFHSLLAISMAHLYRARRKTMEDFFSQEKGDLTIAVVDYATPGFELTQKLKPCANVNVIFLENHGIILNSDNPNILENWKELEYLFCEKVLSDKGWLNIMDGGLESLSESSAPVKVLFPDFAVYLSRITENLVPVPETTEDLWKFNPESSSTKKDLYEIWVAHCLLCKICPDLIALPDPEAEKLSGLPTEQYRLKMK